MKAVCRLFVSTLTGEPEEEPPTAATAVPFLVESAELVAAIVTVAGVGAADGALYNPALEMVPTVELPPETPFTAQVTAVFVVFVTFAVNC